MHHIAKIVSEYRPYLPAITTLAGAIILALGIFLGQGEQLDPKFQGLRLFGAILAAIGAFWSGHRQISSAVESRARDEKVITLSEQLRGYVTGGESFCYAYPVHHTPGKFHWVFIHQGTFPLFEVSVRIWNLSRDLPEADRERRYDLGTIFPGRAHTFKDTKLEQREESHGFNLFFLARNGSWTQEIRWLESPGAQITANRVHRDGESLKTPLLREVSPQFPGLLSDDDAWNTPPPYQLKNH